MKELTLDQKLSIISSISDIQYELNCQTISEDWINSNKPFLRAAWIETAEAMEHLGYKWWKKSEPNIEEVRIELVDIMHFIVSDMIAEGISTDITSEAIIEYEEMVEEYEDLAKPALLIEYTIQNVETLATYIFFAMNGATSYEETDEENYMLDEDIYTELLARLFFCFYLVDMDFIDIFKKFIGKSTLNSFRQIKGYKEGNYMKIWGGLEDNVWLNKVMKEVEIYPENPELSRKVIFNRLEFYYSSVNAITDGLALAKN